MRVVATILATTLMLAAGTPVMAKDYPEFGGRCAMGVAMGKEIATDCKITWTSSSNNQFCFGSEKAKDKFLNDKQDNIQLAFANYKTVIRD